jgi:hypothetical protein
LKLCGVVDASATEQKARSDFPESCAGGKALFFALLRSKFTSHNFRERGEVVRRAPFFAHGFRELRVGPAKPLERPEEPEELLRVERL